MTNKEAIEELRELIEIDLHPCPPIYEEALNLAIKALEERPHGEWLDEKFVAFHLTCNQCGCHLRRQKNEVFEGDFEYNFCPNCGADMRKEADNEVN